MKLKVCGNKHNTLDVAKLQPDYLGFIFYEPSPRNFEAETIEIASSIKKVGVFVDASVKDILQKVTQYNLAIIQLHGNESSTFCELLLAALPNKEITIWKVFTIKGSFDFSVLKNYETFVEAFLFDTKGKFPGGNGYTFNWEILKAYPSTKPFILSGGIGLTEINIIKEFQKTEVSKYCYAIDVNSKFETKPGLKNIQELKKLQELF